MMMLSVDLTQLQPVIDDILKVVDKHKMPEPVGASAICLAFLLYLKRTEAPNCAAYHIVEAMSPAIWGPGLGAPMDTSDMN